MKIFPFFSVIIPVYKVEDYIEKCVNSVLKQNFDSFEIILVDDGSPDKCPQICDEYASKDQRIKVIHKENGGLSDARNLGVAFAKGLYIVFLDSDDYWEGEEALSSIYQILKDEKIDVLIFNSKDVFENKNISLNHRGKYNLDEINSDKTAAIRNLILNNQFPGAAWLHFVKKEFIVRENISFIKGIKAEDIDWVINILYHAQKISAVNNNFHRYLKDRSTSITNTADLNGIQNVLFIVSKWYKILEDDKREFTNYLLSYLAFQYITIYLTYSRIKKSDKKLIFSDIKKYKPILKYSKDRRSKIFRFFINFFGISISSKLISAIYSVYQKLPILRVIK